jgi:hypothetical protein
MTEVTSVNAKVGAVVLAATDVEAIPESEAGQPNGVATLDVDGHLPAAQLPSSVLSSSSEEDAEAVEGTIAPAMPTDMRIAAFAYTIKGAATVKPPTGATTGFSEALIRVQQNSSGGHKISTSGIVWNGGEPVWNEAANAVNLISVFTVNGGATWEGVGPQTGATGPTGPEGVVPNKLLIPSEVVTYKEPGATTTEKRQGLAETHPRADSSNALLLTSGTPVIGALILPAKTVIHGLGFQVSTTEGTAANRTHLWVALLNSKLEKLRTSLDHTSSTNTPLPGNAAAPHALLFESTYETGASPELLYGVLCEVMSSTNPITIIIREANAFLMEAVPSWCALGPTGQTTPGALPSTVTPSALGGKLPYLVAV